MPAPDTSPLDEPFVQLRATGDAVDLGAAPRILAVKLADVGDLLTITPALRALRVRYPQAEISLLAPASSLPVLQGLDLVDFPLPFDKFRFDTPGQAARPANLLYAAGLARRLHALRPDAAIVFHHLTTAFGRRKFQGLLAAAHAPVAVGLTRGPDRSFTHTVEDLGFGAVHEASYWRALALRLGADAVPRPTELALAPHHHAAAERLLSEVGLGDGRSIVALHPGGGAYSPARRWPAEKFAALGDALVRELGAAVAIAGGPDEVALARDVASRMTAPAAILAGRTSLHELGAVFTRVALLISNDSGLLHLAAAVNTPVVGVFGPSNARAWGPYTPAGRSLVVRRDDLPCSPCFYRGHGLGTPQGCAARTCLAELDIMRVLEAARALL